MKIKKIMGKALCLVMLTLCVVMAYATTVQANNWEDEAWVLKVSNSTGTVETNPRVKMDTSKVYIKNLSTSTSSVAVSILGCATVGGTYTDCTYNTAGVAVLQPYTIGKGTSKYMSSIVHERYDDITSTPYAKLSITAYTTGNYGGLWSSDNKNGY